MKKTQLETVLRKWAFSTRVLRDLPSQVKSCWYTSNRKPEIAGIYEIAHLGRAVPYYPIWSYWDGGEWKTANAFVSDALVETAPMPAGDFLWRGVKEEFKDSFIPAGNGWIEEERERG